jgi:dephospho-CoA kinase
LLAKKEIRVMRKTLAKKIEQSDVLKKDKNRLLLGVTGGIASGKTAVSDMLGALGAPTIDFDIIARRVVEPEKPAWKEIVAYFGEEILLKDRCLDRKTLSKIVFNNPDKRKTLEGFTYISIGEEYIKQLDKITAGNPVSIIQVAVPLLIEANMQNMFDKILVVYVPHGTQVKRLTLRDGISEADAAQIILSQMPIDEKIEYADFLINNDKSLDETRRQVEDLWKTLNKILKEKIK